MGIDVFRHLRLLNWSLRKLRLPIGLRDLVLEVGSGGNPHPAAIVLAEKFIDSSHRLKGVKIDRHFVLADAAQLPFRDKTFDFSIAFHVLEHVPEPEKFLAEMSRVSKAGYIETPNVLYERLFPLHVHLLEIAQLRDGLLVKKKPGTRHDDIMYEGNLITEQPRWKKLFDSRPELFHVCYEWKDVAKAKILNPRQSLAWHEFPDSGLAGAQLEVHAPRQTARTETFSLRQTIISCLRWFYVKFGATQIDLDKLLVCPVCHGQLTHESKTYECVACRTYYAATPIADFTTPCGRL
jgi:SAM-dependent methyltransferase